MGAERPQWNYVCGNASNIALNGVTKSLGSRSLDHGVRVLGVNPGAVETERIKTLLQGRAEKQFGDATRWREVIASTQPLGRAATTKEIADVVVFLASDRAGWICGEVVNVDAGNIYRHNQL
jgi:3-oxoacyl-[acyl-carrier protein] reductase